MTPPGAELFGSDIEATISMSVVRGLVEAVEHGGVARQQFLRAAALSPEQLASSEARVPLSHVQQLCERALEMTGDAALGLHWASWFSERMFVPVSNLIAHSASLRQGLELLAQFFPLLCDQAAYRVVEQAEQVILQRLPSPGESPLYVRFSSEMMMGGFFRLIASFSGLSTPGQVSFEYAAPAYHGEYAALFGDALTFEQPFTGIAFHRALLEAPSPQKDDGVREALQDLAERRLTRIHRRTPYAVRVREYLVHEGWRQRSDMQHIARALDLSVRSLRRRLSEEGKTYHEVMNEALAIVATHLLRDERRTIQEVAYELGFSEMSAFYRAFKRWTGTTPRLWREQQRV